MQFWINRRRASPARARFIWSGRRLVSGLILFGLVLVFSGCARGPKIIDPSKGNALELGEFKRYENNMERDFLHHFSRKAYAEPRKRRLPHGELQLMPGTGELMLSDRGQLLEDFGPPTLMRYSFKSREGEKIEEWLYRDSLLVFQFVDGQLVYQGPMSDLETLLIIHGYPDRFSRAQIHPDSEVQVFTYQPLFSTRISIFKLVNDILAFKQEGG